MKLDDKKVQTGRRNQLKSEFEQVVLSVLHVTVHLLYVCALREHILRLTESNVKTKSISLRDNNNLSYWRTFFQNNFRKRFYF